MTIGVRAAPQTLHFHHLARFIRTPKGILLVILALLTLVALPSQGIAQAAPGVAGAVATAALLDVAIIRWRQGEWQFPSGALLTGLIIALVLRVQEPWTVAATSSVIAIGSKHLLRTRWSNMFNPAALALVASSFLFATGQSWWGALPDLGPAGLPILAATGLFITDRINKLPLVAVFLGAYFALFTLASFLGQPVQVAEVFRAPDVQAVLFFAFFMLDDPPTCPIRYKDQIFFGAIVALASFLVFTIAGGVYYLPAGLLAGNAWESGRRWLGRMLGR